MKFDSQIVAEAIEVVDSLIPYPIELANDDRQRRRFKKYHPVYTPLRIIEPLGFQKYLNTKCKIKYHKTHGLTISLKDPKLVTSQRYVYGGKIKWYLEHPDEIFIQHTHWGKLEWSCVFYREGWKKIGNGNHRIIAAMLLGVEELKITKLEAIDVEYSNRYLRSVCRNGGADSFVLDIPKEDTGQRLQRLTLFEPIKFQWYAGDTKCD